jgi:alpha-tubulin suppressor-like RCC1 family protein
MNVTHYQKAATARKKPALLRALVLATILVSVCRAGAEPRTPLPEMPEWPLYYQGFNSPYQFGATNPEVVVTSSGILTQSWSGYALDRSGPVVVPFVIPALDSAGHTNVSCATGGALRWWLQPHWATALTANSSGGPDKYAKLVELAAVGGGQSVSLWSLQATPDGSALRLVSQTDAGPVELLRAAILWETDAPHCVAVNYGSQGTALFIDGQQVASGSGTPALPPSAAVLVVGSGLYGSDTSEAEFDEFFSFATPLMAADVAYYYMATANWAALGPVTPEEKAARHQQILALRQAAAMSPQGRSPQPDGPSPASPCGDGGPVYLTNVFVTDLTTQSCTVTLSVFGGSNATAYCLYQAQATNLVAAVTNAAWQWRQYVYACDTVVLTNQPAEGALYVVAPEKDTDGDGMPDSWEILHGLNPLDPSDAGLDPDDDGLTNLQEYQAGSNPFDTMLVAWGDNVNGEGTVPWGLGAVTGIAAGGGSAAGGHTLVLTPQGTVLAWGANGFGQTTVPNGLSNVVAVAAGGDQSAALKADGTVVQWGCTFADVPAGLTDATAISAGYQHLLALRTGGAVVSWGRSNSPANTVPAGLNGVKAIAAGWNHNLALRSNGTVVVWGLGGQSLGWNLTNAPADLTDVAAIAAGALHSVVLRSNGTMVAWGYNAHGETNIPPNLCDVVAIAAGRGYTLALEQDGTVTGWGPGVPPLPTPLDQLKSIAAGPAHALALRQGVLTPLILRHPQSQAKPGGATATFGVSAWSRREPAYQWQFNGANIAGATSTNLIINNVQDSSQGTYRVLVSNGAGAVLSDEARLVRALPPVIVSPLSPQVAWVAPRSNFVLSVSATAQGADLSPLSYLWYKDGQAIPWALSHSNLVLGMFEAVREGQQYSVVVTNVAGSTSSVPWTVHVMAPGTLAAWGGDADGVKSPPCGMSNIMALASGQQHAAALIEGGTVIAWGNNDYGQTNVPASITNVVAIACGSHHTLALKADGTVVAWGRDEAGETEVPDGLTNVVGIAAGGMHNLAMTNNGGLTAWGMDVGPMPANLTNVTAIAAGLDFNLALRADGTVVAWGANDFGQTNVPQNLTNVVAISAGHLHGLALRSDGTVVSWGYNWAGQTNVPPDLTNAMAVAAGSLFSMALRNDGTVVAWGDNTLGQTNVLLGVNGVKSIAAGGAHALAAIFSPLVQYPVDVTKDLLLIYNTNSTDSVFVKDYYLAHRPMVSGANVLGIGCPTNEVIDTAAFSNQVLAPVQGWLAAHPTKKPQYVVLFLDIPSRIHEFIGDNEYASNSVSFALSTKITWTQPFVTHINMGGTNDCMAYINKLEYMGTSNSPGKLLISSGTGGYGTGRYVFDDTRIGYPGDDYGANARDDVLGQGVPLSLVTYINGPDDPSLSNHVTTATNVAGYLCWGFHSYLGTYYAVDLKVKFTGTSGWYLIETIESFNGERAIASGNFLQWFSPNAFGGAGYTNTPGGAITHTDEPWGFRNDGTKLFGLWCSGKNFGISAWAARRSQYFQAVGDPLVVR